MAGHAVHLLYIITGNVGKRQPFRLHLLPDLMEVLCVVTNTLQIIQHMEIGTDGLLIPFIHAGGQLDEEPGQGAVDKINTFLVFSDFCAFSAAFPSMNKKERRKFSSTSDSI